MFIHPSREERSDCSKPKGEYLHSSYLHTKFSQSDNNSRVPTCLRAQYTFSASVPVLTTTSVQVSQNNCNHPSSEIIPDLPVTLHNCPNSDQKKHEKQTHSKVSCFVSSSVRSNFHFLHSSGRFYWLTVLHAQLKHFHNCSSNHGCYLMHLRNQDQHYQTGDVHMSLSLSLCRQPTVSTPSSTVPSVPWRFPFLSLSALQYLYCQANHNASGFNLKITSQCKHPSSPTALAHYRTSGVQLLTSYFTNVATKPRSLTKQTRPLQALMPTFLKCGN